MADTRPAFDAMAADPRPPSDDAFDDDDAPSRDAFDDAAIASKAGRVSAMAAREDQSQPARKRFKLPLFLSRIPLRHSQR